VRPITERLLADHKAFRKLLQDLEALAARPPAERDPARGRSLAGLLKRMLLLHAHVEDVVLFPAAAGLFPEPLLKHLSEEHKTIESYVTRLEAQLAPRPPSHAWPQTLALLSAGLSAHFKREEEEVFPEMTSKLSPEFLSSLSVAAESLPKP
jgi:hemerythrin-like domain-containing protein